MKVHPCLPESLPLSLKTPLSKIGPPKRLEEWLQSWENGNDDIEAPLDNEYAQG